MVGEMSVNLSEFHFTIRFCVVNVAQRKNTPKVTAYWSIQIKRQFLWGVYMYHSLKKNHKIVLIYFAADFFICVCLIVVSFICVRFLSHNKMSLSWTFIHFANDLFEVFVTGCIIPALRGPNKTILARDVFGEPLHPVRIRHSSPSRPGEPSTIPVSP